MSALTAVIRREALLAAGIGISAAETAIASGSTWQVAVQGAAPILLAALARQLTTTTQEDAMADLTALQQAATDLQNAVAAVEAHVTQLKSEATPQAAVDAVTASVTQANHALQAASQQ